VSVVDASGEDAGVASMAGVPASSPFTTLIAQITAVRVPMASAFAVRLDRLRGMGSPVPLLDRDVIDAWFLSLLATLQVPLDDPAIVPTLATLVAHGRAHGIDGAGQRVGLEAFVWACRDVLPDDCPTRLAAEMGARGAVIDRLAVRRMTSPTSPIDA